MVWLLDPRRTMSCGFASVSTLSLVLLGVHRVGLVSGDTAVHICVLLPSATLGSSAMWHKLCWFWGSAAALGVLMLL